MSDCNDFSCFLLVRQLVKLWRSLLLTHFVQPTMKSRMMVKMHVTRGEPSTLWIVPTSFLRITKEPRSTLLCWLFWCLTTQQLCAAGRQCLIRVLFFFCVCIISSLSCVKLICRPTVTTGVYDTLQCKLFSIAVWQNFLYYDEFSSIQYIQFKWSHAV